MHADLSSQSGSIGLSLFLTLFVMTPVLDKVYDEAYLPLSENKIKPKKPSTGELFLFAVSCSSKHANPTSAPLCQALQYP